MNKDKNPSSDADEQQSSQSSALVPFVNKENPQSGTLLERIYTHITRRNSNSNPAQPRRIQILIQFSVTHGLPFAFSMSETMSGGYNYALMLGTHDMHLNISNKKVIARIIKDIIKYLRGLNELASRAHEYSCDPYFKSRLVLDSLIFFVKFACFCVGTTQEVLSSVKEGVASAKIYVEKAVNKVRNQSEINTNSLEFLPNGEDDWDLCDREIEEKDL
jgi:hypothetical protein